jgi:hypothetical protein
MKLVAVKTARVLVSGGKYADFIGELGASGPTMNT